VDRRRGNQASEKRRAWCGNVQGHRFVTPAFPGDDGGSSGPATDRHGEEPG